MKNLKTSLYVQKLSSFILWGLNMATTCKKSFPLTTSYIKLPWHKSASLTSSNTFRSDRSCCKISLLDKSNNHVLLSLFLFLIGSTAHKEAFLGRCMLYKLRCVLGETCFSHPCAEEAPWRHGVQAISVHREVARCESFMQDKARQLALGTVEFWGNLTNWCGGGEPVVD